MNNSADNQFPLLVKRGCPIGRGRSCYCDRLSSSVALTPSNTL